MEMVKKVNDLISREALRKAFHKRIYYFNKSSWDEANAIIDNAPTVPQINVFCENADEKAVADLKTELQSVIEVRPKGEWIVTAEDNDGVHRICCPFCSYEQGSNNVDTIKVTFTKFPNFCEDCGAYMKGGEEE